ncbi:disease resistance-like protein DSC1 isoform X2 [Hibiscus syriacus]|nr:disease resistance-like protein DSC1 isoform X2 [Hibiscus syriacus]
MIYLLCLLQSHNSYSFMAASSSSSSSPQTDTCLNFITHLLKAFKDLALNVFFHEEKPRKDEQGSQGLPQAIASPSSSRGIKHQVFLSFRGEDTRLNFTAHLLKALEDRGISVFFDEKDLEKGNQYLSPALSQAIAASKISLIVLSKDYASSNSCLEELSNTMDRKRTQGRFVIPIFYHVDPSHVRKFGGNFKASFEKHEKNRPIDQVKRWKDAFAKVGEIPGWHIKGGKVDRPETEYIEKIVDDVTKKLMNKMSRSASEGLVGIDYQRKMILDLINQKDSRVIGLWGMGGIGKSTLADSVYKGISPEFRASFFLQNVSEKIKKQGRESLRNELLSKLLNEKEIRIDTPSIGSPYQERLNNLRVAVVLDDVSHPDQIDLMGVRHFRDGSKIIVTSRDRQVLKNVGVDKIHEVKKLNVDDSLQLFSTFAFKQLNPDVDFRDLSNKFLEYAQGNPLALKVLGSKLYKKSRKEWESEMDKLKEYGQPEISQILKSSFDGLDELENNIFLDMACFFKGEPMQNVEEILSCFYKGAVCGITNLVDKHLLDISPVKDIPINEMFRKEEIMRKHRQLKNSWLTTSHCRIVGDRITNFLDQSISMHDMVEEMGKNIVRQESKDLGKRSRLWIPEDVSQVLIHNKGTDRIEGMKLDMSQIGDLKFCPTVFDKMHNLRYINFYFPPFSVGKYKKLHANQVGFLSLPYEIRFLHWEYYPFKYLSSSFNPKNFLVLKLPYSDIEQLWNEDDHQGLTNLREINLSHCKNLRKVPNLLGAIHLEILCCRGCESLVELPCLNHLSSLKTLELQGCHKLKKFPEIPNHFTLQCLEETGIEEVPGSIEHLVRLRKLCLRNSSVKNVSNNILKLESLHCLDLSHCPITNFPEIPRSLKELYLSETQIQQVSLSSYSLINLQYLDMRGSSIQKLHCNVDLPGLSETSTVDVPSSILSLGYLKVDYCKSLELLSELPLYLRYLNAHGCTSLEKVSFTNQNQHLYEPCSFDDNDDFFMIFSNCLSLKQDSIDNIVENAMLKIGSMAEKWTGKYVYGPKKMICCFPGNEISTSKFEYQSVNSSLNLKIEPNRCRYMVFSIFLVADLTPASKSVDFECSLKLTAADGSHRYHYTTGWSNELDFQKKHEYVGDHVFILFSSNMIRKDEGFEEASFKFYVYMKECCKVEKCGVHVSYIPEELNPAHNIRGTEMISGEKGSKQ